MSTTEINHKQSIKEISYMNSKEQVRIFFMYKPIIFHFMDKKGGQKR